MSGLNLTVCGAYESPGFIRDVLDEALVIDGRFLISVSGPC